MRFVQVLVERNEHLAIPREVAPWEVPVLQAVHTPEKVKVMGVVNHERLKDRPYPDAEMELERLERKYGRDVDTDDKPFVFAVYGQGPLGVAALRKAIEETALAERADEVDPLS